MEEKEKMNEDVRKKLDTMMAIALIRSICVKGIVSKEVMSAVEKKGKKCLKKKKNVWYYLSVNKIRKNSKGG